MADIEYRKNPRGAMQGVGGTEVHIGPDIGRLSTDGILNLCTAESTDRMTQGRLLSQQHQITDPDARQHQQLVEAVRAAGEDAQPAERGAYAHPLLQAEARFAHFMHDEREPLTPAFIRDVENLPEDPSHIEPRDIDTVVRAWMRAPELDRPFLRPVIDRVPEYHDREAERAELRAQVINGSRPGRAKGIGDRAAQLLATRIREATPELTEPEAMARAREQVIRAVTKHDMWRE